MSDAADLHHISPSIYRVLRKGNQKPQDGNQEWAFDCAAGAGPFAHKGACLILN